MADPRTPRTPEAARSAPLGRSFPSRSRYKGRIVAALAALVVASAATLVVPVAVRRVIDHGFSEQGGASSTPISDADPRRRRSRAGERASAITCVITLGERVVADLSAAVFAT